jgi:two-component system chemotaxis response regulator CheB
MNMIDVLIVDDSLVVRDLISYILKSDKNINVFCAGNGKEAIDFIKIRKPSVITMDIHMPVMDGIDATKIIMETTPVPIIIVSSLWDSNNVDDSFNALRIGAVAITEKPVGFDSPRYKEIADNLMQLVKLMSEIKVVKRLKLPELKERKPAIDKRETQREKNKIICIGASTGGPVVIEKILSNLRVPVHVPILIVQHIMAGFVEGFVEWLGKTSKIKVKLAEQEEILLANICYVAPDFYHMSVSKDKKILLQNNPAINGLKPSVSFLFDSILGSYSDGILAVLLSGMGKDGAFELKKLKEAGSITIVQDSESAVVYGMPGEAVKLGAASYIFTPDEIINFINELN